MDALTVLIWLGLVVAALIVLALVGLFVVVVYAAVVGLRKMRADEDQDDRSIFKSGGES